MKIAHVAADNDIARISLKHQLVSEYTSRVAVEERLVRNPRGELVSVPVPNEFPEGRVASTFFGTATSDTLRLVLAAMLLLFAAALTLMRRIERREWKTA